MLYLPHIFNQLASRSGLYEGPGVDVENGQLTGRLTIDSMTSTQGIAVTLVATRDDDSIHHDERSLIVGGASSYIALMSALPGKVHELTLRSVKNLDDGGIRCMFGRGDVARKSTLPIELAIDLWADGDVGFSYSWGLAGQPYRTQLAARMRRV